MPFQTPCPKCSKIGWVRVENVITGPHSVKAFYCGNCEHSWSIEEATPPPPMAKPPMTRKAAK